MATITTMTRKQSWRANKRIIKAKIRQRVRMGGTVGKFHRGDKVQAFINRG